MTLETLLARACISRWNVGTWFRGARLVQNTLLVPDIDDYGAIIRGFADRLREVLPDLTITFSPHAAPSEPSAKSSPKSVFKKAYTGRIEQSASQQDLY